MYEENNSSPVTLLTQAFHLPSQFNTLTTSSSTTTSNTANTTSAPTITANNTSISISPPSPSTDTNIPTYYDQNNYEDHILHNPCFNMTTTPTIHVPPPAATSNTTFDEGVVVRGNDDGIVDWSNNNDLFALPQNFVDKDPAANWLISQTTNNSNDNGNTLSTNDIHTLLKLQQLNHARTQLHYNENNDNDNNNDPNNDLINAHQFQQYLQQQLQQLHNQQQNNEIISNDQNNLVFNPHFNNQHINTSVIDGYLENYELRELRNKRHVVRKDDENSPLLESTLNDLMSISLDFLITVQMLVECINCIIQAIGSCRPLSKKLFVFLPNLMYILEFWTENFGSSICLTGELKDIQMLDDG
ncbi:10938_t:CDS:2, partial [Entrophospora sp. SA101]